MFVPLPLDATLSGSLRLVLNCRLIFTKTAAATAMMATVQRSRTT